MPEALVEAQAQRRGLLAWYRRQARVLPWRKTKGPYAIWISEVMLQQTQVATVIPYFERFLHDFPTLPQLARAPLERVLKLWSGLGYYRRARNLRRAARQVVRDHGGQFPRNERDLRALPGVGKYTARAILSIAYNLPYFVLDGNVARVIARLKAMGGDPSTSAFRSEVECHLERLLSRRSPGNFNQALMELGQTVCLPREPRCPVCPLQTWCLAHQAQKAESYPAARVRRKTELTYLAAAVIQHGDKVALVRGLDEGLLTDLWNFPAAFGRTRSDALDHLEVKFTQAAPGSIQLGPCLAELSHTITFRSIRVVLYSAEVAGMPRNLALHWIPLKRLASQAVSQLARKIAAALHQLPVTESPSPSPKPSGPTHANFRTPSVSTLK